MTTGLAKQCGHVLFEDPYFLITSSKRLNQFMRFLTHFNAVVLWTRLLI